MKSVFLIFLATILRKGKCQSPNDVTNLSPPIVPSPQWHFLHNNKPDCAPQPTPLYGTKWCNFTRKASELGAVCYFTCNEGYFLEGAQVNECIIYHGGAIARFNSSGQICKKQPSYLINQAANGPYLISSRQSPYNIWARGSNYKLTTVDITNATESFYILRPGLNKMPDSVSFKSTDDQRYHVVQQGSKILVLRSNEIIHSLGTYADNASFKLATDLFYKGFSSFESYSDPGFYITGYTDRAALSKPANETTRSHASFSWVTKVDLTSGNFIT